MLYVVLIMSVVVLVASYLNYRANKIILQHIKKTYGIEED